MRILGTGSALPAHTLTNDDLSKFLDTSDEWIRTHTGIRSRQVITDETLLQLAARAANAALENAGLAAADIDYILASSVLPDTITPSLGCLLQAEIGANCPALDVNAVRKSRGLTQEELAEALFVSRTAISKWESGRGYPSIDSLKEISRYFSVSIDELLSGDQLVLIAEKENKSNLNGLCDLLFGFTDLLSLMLIFLPLYTKPVDGYIYSVSLIEYVDSEIWIRMTYWGLFIALTIIGIVNILMVNFKFEKGKKVITFLSVGLSIITVLYLAIAREPYAVTVAFLLLLIKGGLLYKRAMAGR